MPSLILTIARTTFLESVRQPIYLIMILICGLMQAFNTASTGYSMGYTESGEVSGDNKLLFDLGLASVFLCGTLLAGFIATAVISREIERKTVLTVVSKPIPRPAVILGKYLGISTAVLIALITMSIFLLLGIRHGVLSTARDEVDTVVVTFGLAAVLGSVLVAVWGNFFYGWHFPQVASLLMCPLLVVAWILMLVIGKHWQWQSPLADFKPQITLACFAIGMALLVLTAIAVAASTRLGQVMTIVICFGAFMLGLLSNYFVGRHAHEADLVGQILEAKPEREAHTSLTNLGDIYFITLKSATNRTLKPGDSFFYSPNPNGFDMPLPAFEKYGGDPADDTKFFEPGTPAALMVIDARARAFTVRNVGNPALPVDRPPRTNDYIFASPSQTRIGPLVAWGLIPNMQFFWLTDAVTQNRLIPASHILRLAGYSAAQIGLFLSLAVLLFQRREVG